MMRGIAETSMSSTITQEDLIDRVMSHVAAMQLAGHGDADTCEQAKAVQRQSVAEQEYQISKLCKEVAFLRQGFTRLPEIGAVEAAGFHDFTVMFTGAFSRRHNRLASTRRVHQCILASKSDVMKREFTGYVQASYQCTKPNYELADLRFVTNSVIAEALGVSKITCQDIYDAFIDYFYIASVPESSMKEMWADLLFLALFYNVASLRDDCIRYISDRADILSQDVVIFTEIMKLGLEFNSMPIITRATDAYIKLPASYPDSAEYKQLVKTFPHVQDLISQASRARSNNESMMASNKLATGPH